MMSIVLIDPKRLVINPLREKARTVPDRNDGRYITIKESIVVNGIKQPLLVQQGTNMILGGHTRREIAMELSMNEVPVQYVDVDDEEARYMLIEDNLDRAEDEKDIMKIAWQCYELKMITGKKQGRPKKNNPGELFLDGNVSNKMNMSETAFRRYVLLNNLIEPLQKMASAGQIGVKSGAVIAQISPENQEKVYESIKNRAMAASYRMKEDEAEGYRHAFEKDTYDGDQSMISKDQFDDFDTMHEDDDLDSLFEDKANRENYSSADLLSLQAMQKLHGKSNADVLQIAYDVDRETSSPIEERDARMDATTKVAQKKMESVLSIKDEKAQKKYAVTKLRGTVRSYQLAAERAEVELMTELATLAPDTYEEIEDQWGILTKAYERAARKFELALQTLRAKGR